MPSDALMNHSRPPIGNGARSSAPMRSAIRRASSASATGSRMIPNSSPPKRATVSPGRRPPTSRWPTAASSRSPTAWPTLSLMTLNRSRSSRMTAIGSRSSVRWPARAWRDPVGQQLAVGQAGRRVVERAALRHVEEPRVVERDRGQLGEAGEGVRSRAAPNARSVVPEASPRTPTTRPPEASGTPTTDPNVPVGRSRRAVAQGVVVVDGQRRARRGRPRRRGPRRSASCAR